MEAEGCLPGSGELGLVTGCLKGEVGSGLPGTGDYACRRPRHCGAAIGPRISRFVVLGDWGPSFSFVRPLAAGAVSAGAPTPHGFEPRMDLWAHVGYVPCYLARRAAELCLVSRALPALVS